jgi:hypothetical protein
LTDVVGLSRAADFAVAVAGAAPGDAEIAAGLLTDLATELRRDSSTAATGDGMLGRLAAPAGGLFAELAAAYMLDRRLIEAIDYGERARALPIAATDRALQCHIDATLGSVLVFAGRMDEGWRLLEGSIARATEARLELQAARGYRMIGSSASVLVEYERATRWLVAGVAYTERVERFNDRHYMAAHLGHVLWATGDWNAAVEMAEHALADGRGGITTRITALHILGYVATARGEPDRWLAEAAALGEEMAELQRVSSAWWGLAERAVLAGDPDARSSCASEATRLPPGCVMPPTCSPMWSPALGPIWIRATPPARATGSPGPAG